MALIRAVAEGEHQNNAIHREQSLSLRFMNFSP